MENISKKQIRCNLLIDSILRSIYQYAKDNDSTNVVDEAEIQYQGDIAGYVTYAVNRNVTEVGRSWDYDFPPSSDEVEITLLSAICNMFYGGSGKRLPNLTRYINNQLLNFEGKLIEY